MRNNLLFSKVRVFTTFVSFSISGLVSAQEYNFTFYNGDVAQEKNPTEVSQKQSEQSLAPKSAKATSKEKIESDTEKLKRTGLSLIAGYSHDNFKGSRSFFDHLDNQALRVGLSFISSYDFSLDLEFLSNSIDGSLNEGDQTTNISGRIPGISIGIRNNYWLTDSFALSLGGNIRGVKGSLNSNEVKYSYKSYGASLSAGPVFQAGKVQIQLAYEYGLNNIEIEKRNEGEAKDQWVQNSALKGMLSYRF